MQECRNTRALPWEYALGQPFWKTIWYHLVKLSNSIPRGKTQNVYPTDRWGTCRKMVFSVFAVTDGGN